MRALILGAAAGGGLPQWNCGCQNCNAARDGTIPAASQSSVAFSANATDWAILNASPDIRYQIAATPSLHPTGPRDSPISSVVLTNGDIDHIAGLLTLREKQAFKLFTTSAIAEVLDDNPIFRALDPKFVERKIVELGDTVEIASGLSAELFSVPGKVPLYMEGDEVDTELEGKQTVGVRLMANDSEVFYLPGCANVTAALAKRLSDAPLVFFDGTVWENEEMIRLGVGAKTGARMGHMSMSGERGSMAAFEPLNVARKQDLRFT
ncbi:UNVERIFIED_CONTAM: hypothetical protein GTU68_065833 [Idotea baltica]|nr:hypothetical protein [Idotea baltica]